MIVLHAALASTLLLPAEGAAAASMALARAGEHVAQDEHGRSVVAEDPRPALPDAFAAVLEEIDTAVDAGDLETARAVLEAVVAELERMEVESGESWVEMLLALDDRAGRLGSVPAQRVLREERLEVQARRLPPDHLEVLGAKHDLATARKSLGDLDGARTLLEDVLVARQRLLAPDHPDLLATKQNLGATMYRLGDLQPALALQEEVVAARERILEPGHPDVLGAKLELANTMQALGDLQGAHALLEEVLEVWARTLPSDHARVLAAKNNLAAVKLRLGEYEGAAEVLEEVHAAWARLLPADHLDLIRVKHNLAAALYRLGRLEEACPLQEEILDARTRLLPPDHPDTLKAKANLAVTKRHLGDLAGARALQEDVLAANTRLHPPGHPSLLGAMLSLAGTRRKLGDLEGARMLTEEVVAVRERLLPPDHVDLLTAKASLALCMKAAGDLEEARALEEGVLESRLRLLPPDHPAVLQAMGNLASTEQDLGHDAEACRLLDEVVAAWSTQLPRDHVDLLAVRGNLANARSSLGDLEGARVVEEEVLAARERLFPPDHPDLLGAMGNLATTRWDLGDHEGARELITGLLRGMRVRARSLRMESPRVAREGARAELRRLFGLRVWSEPLPGESEMAAECFSVLENLRAVSVASSELARAIGEHPDLSELHERVARRRAEINDLSAAPPGTPEEIEAWRARLLALATDRDGAEYELRRRLAETRAFVGEVDAESIEARLGHGQLAVSYVRYPRSSEAEGEAGSQGSIRAYLVQPGRGVRSVELGSGAEIERLVRAWRGALGRPLSTRGVSVGDTSKVDDAAERAAGDRLRQRILDPVLESAGEVQTLYLCPDDALCLLPVDALPWKDGRLGDEVRVHTQASLLPLVHRLPPSTAGPSLLAVGGPAFGEPGRGPVDPAGSEDGSSDDRDPSGPGTRPFLSLVGAKEEARAAGALFHAIFDVEPGVLTGAGVTKEALAKGVVGARFVHIATHGWFAPEVFRSQLEGITDAVQRRVVEDAEEALRGFAPETLCGLALAGANLGRDAVGRVPGVLTAEELATLDLSACELAVLSACETNVGIRRAGQGIQSLQGALYAAGARSSITSLWKVDDAATRQLMEVFYRKLWGDGLGKADALWAAKTALREEGHPVRDWAAWVLTGDPD